MKIEQWDISNIIPYDKNPRDNKGAVKKVVMSLKEYGWQQPIVVDKAGVIIVGHTRLKAAKKMKLKTCPVMVANDLNEAQVKAYRIADNKTGEFASWDDDLLLDEIKNLIDLDFDIELTGFELGDFDLEEPGGGLTDPDEVPEAPEGVTVLGDLWILGDHRLLCGDSTDIKQVERLMDGQKADMVFTDPPYGYSYQSNHQSNHSMLKNDDKILDFMPVLYESMEQNSCVYVCGSHQTIEKWKPIFSETFTYKNLIVWKKNNWSMGDLKGAYAGQHELILFGHKGKIELLGKRDTDVWSFDREPPKDHPTQKPVDLIQYAIEKVLCNRVLDLFLGSGSTLIACQKTNRKCYGMELDPHYCDVIVKRWEQYTGQMATLETKENKIDNS